MWTFIFILILAFFVYQIIKWFNAYSQVEAFVVSRLAISYAEWNAEKDKKETVEFHLQMQINSMLTLELPFIAESVGLATWRTKNAIIIASKKFYRMKGISEYLIDCVKDINI